MAENAPSQGEPTWTMSSVSPTVYHMLERMMGKRILVVIDRDFGYEGKLAVVSHNPPGIWLVEGEAVILRSTVISPIPQIVNRETKGEIFLHLDAVQRLESIPDGRPERKGSGGSIGGERREGWLVVQGCCWDPRGHCCVFFPKTPQRPPSCSCLVIARPCSSHILSHAQ